MFRKTMIFSIIVAVTLAAQATELRRSTTFEIQECDTSSFDEELVKAHAYVNKIKDRIVQNNLDVFNGDLAPDKICIGVEFKDIGGRAWADAGTGTIKMETDLIMRARNDAQLAVVIAHELAHLSMRHTLDASPVTGTRRAEIQSVMARIRQLNESIRALGKDMPDYQTRYTTLNTQLEEQLRIANSAITTEIGADALNNWEEAEADLVGAHLYLKAGFTADELTWRNQQVILAEANGEDVHGPPPDLNAAELRRQALAECGTTDVNRMNEPARGRQSYPSNCWTVWRILKKEPDTNPNFRNLMTDATSVVNLSSAPSLSEVKAEIENFNETPDPKQ